jgi:PleD family two-component response regulator
VEPSLERAEFIQECLVEISERPAWRGWQGVDVFSIDQLDDAIDVLRAGGQDIVLANLDLPDSHGLHTVVRLRAAVPGVPIVVISDEQSEASVARLLRHGAQDVCFRPSIDCDLLATTISRSIARHKLVDAFQSASCHDPLTGLLNEGSFCESAERELRLAARWNQRMTLLVIEAAESAELIVLHGEDERDLLLMEVAEVLRRTSDDALIGRLSGDQFGALIPDSGLKLPLAAIRRRLAIGTVSFNPRNPLTVESLIHQARARLSILPMPRLAPQLLAVS